MLFPTHLLAAALAGRFSRLSTPWLVVGAALPDIVDKPLGLVGLTQLYHSVGHSILVLGVVVPIALAYPTGRAVAVGWGGHLALDALQMVLNGRPADLLSLAWPVAAPADPLAIPPGQFFFFYLGSPSFVLEVGLWLLAALLVVRDCWPESGTDAADNQH